MYILPIYSHTFFFFLAISSTGATNIHIKIPCICVRISIVYPYVKLLGYELYMCSNLLGYPKFSSVAQLCLTLWDPMNCSTPGLPVHHQLLESTQTHVDQVSDAIQSSNPLSSPYSSCTWFFPESGSFPMSQLFASGGQSIGVSASTSVLPVNTQDWSPLGWTSWISLQSEGLSRVFSNTTVQKHQFFGAQLSL